jgi:hypothetical protein
MDRAVQRRASQRTLRIQQQLAHWRAKAGEQGGEELEVIGDAHAPAAQA